MQGEGLLILRGERQRQLQEQIAATEASRTTLVQENKELQKQARPWTPCINRTCLISTPCNKDTSINEV